MDDEQVLEKALEDDLLKLYGQCSAMMICSRFLVMFQSKHSHNLSIAKVPAPIFKFRESSWLLCFIKE